MSIEDFIREALYKPNDYIAYHVARELAELHPDKAIIEGQTGFFDMDAFVRDEKCAVVEQKSVFRHVTTQWTGAGKSLKQETRNSWLNVLWKGQLLDVILITWIEGYYFRRHHWIVAEEQQVAEQFFDAVCDWSCAVRGEILVFQGGCFEKDQQLLDSIRNATFDNLILYGSLKQQIQDDFQRFIESREVYERYGIPWKRGALFIGPPGNGKTHTLKAIINKLDKPCIYVRSFEDHEELAEVFNRARLIPPCLVVFEDLDSMVTNENRSFFLNELDGFRSNTGVVVLATTNHPEKLDPAILERPSRFDRKYYFQLPAAAERRAYIENWNEGLQADMRISKSVAAGLVDKTKDFSFAYLKELVVASMMQWISSSEPRSMDKILLVQADALRGQMTANNEKASAQSA